MKTVQEIKDAILKLNPQEFRQIDKVIQEILKKLPKDCNDTTVKPRRLK